MNQLAEFFIEHSKPKKVKNRELELAHIDYISMCIKVQNLVKLC